MCAGHILLPRSLQIELPDISTGDPLCRGGFGDVWKREYQGQEVAVKVLRRYANSDLQKITRVSRWWSYRFLFNALIVVFVVTNSEVLQGIRNVERTPPSERVAPVGSDNVWDAVRDGVEMDAKRQHQPIRESAPG